MAMAAEEVPDVLEELEATMKKVFQSMDTMLHATKPTKGSVEDLADHALRFNLALDRLESLTDRKETQALPGGGAPAGSGLADGAARRRGGGGGKGR